MKRNYTVAVDIGGTKIRGILWNGSRAVRSIETATPQAPRRFDRTLKTMVAKLGRGDVGRIGIGTAGVVSGTTLIFSPNIPRLRRYDFQKAFPKTRVKVDNDARSFARAQVRAHRFERARVFVFTLGTGVGRAFSERGTVKKLKVLEYPEHWEKEYQRLRRNVPPAVLASYLAEKLAPFLSRFKAQAVVVGGSTAHPRNFWEPFQRELSYKSGVRIITRAKWPRNSGAIGAALLFRVRN